MDHPFMYSRRASSSVFSFKAADASLKVKEEEEEEVYDDSAEEEEEEEEEDEEGEEIEESYPKKKRMDLGGGSTGKKGSTGGAGGGGLAVNPLPPGCQVDRCVADLTDSKRYHQRHKVCENHSKAEVVIVAGQRQRFCQQCSRFSQNSKSSHVL